MEIKSSSPQELIMDLLKTRFSGLVIWNRIETPLVVMCSDIPPIYDDETKEQFVKQLRNIKDFLTEQGVNPDDLKFIEEEIDTYEKTQQISLYNELDDTLPQEVIVKYSKRSHLQEGVINIGRAYNWEQLKKLSRGVYEKEQLVKFFISPEKTIQGQIVAEIYETPVEIPIASVQMWTGKEEKAPKNNKQLFLFGEKIDTKKWILLKEIPVHFRVYRFISEHNQEFMLLSTEKHAVGEYIVKGVTTKVHDFRKVTDSLKLSTRMPYIFVHTIQNRILKYKSHEEFKKRLTLLGVSKKTMFEFPFTNKYEGKNYILKNPSWFKWFIWSWLTHARSGQIGFHEYPLHILMLGPQSSGKSSLLNALKAKSKETSDVFSGSSSTLKRLIPSFKYSPAKIGYLAESNRFAFLDELLRCIVNTTTRKEGSSSRDESVAMMNDLLEHQKREAGSGVSSVYVNMTARVLGTTNPVRSVNNVADLMQKLDVSFLSRWLIYWQSKEHVDMIRDSTGDLKLFNHDYTTNDFISLLDYLHSFKATFDVERIMNVYKEVMPILTSDLLQHYRSRHTHHIICLMDGLVKARCMFDRDMSFKAVEEDYVMLEKIWKSIIQSWLDYSNIKDIPVKERYHYLPESAQWLFDAICDAKKPLTRFEVEEIALKELTKNEFYSAYQVLDDQQMIKVNNNGYTKPYYMEDKNT